MRFKNADDANVDSNDPLVVPSTAREYSFSKMLQLRMTVGPSVELSKLGFYTDGATTHATWTGVHLWAYAATSRGYKTPAVPVQTVDPPRVIGATSIAYTDALTYQSTAYLNLGGTSGGVATTGNIGAVLQLVCEVETSASQGTLQRRDGHVPV